MFFEIPQNLILMTAGAFLLGWLLSSISGSMSSRFKARKRDPRDDRIRSLEAEHRIAQSVAESLTEKVEELEKDLESTSDGIEKRDNVITHQQEKIDKSHRDLKESVMKTRELRSELSDRATQNIKSEVKLREVETELEVSQASTDLIATGVLDYSLTPEVEEVADGENDEDMLDASDMTNAAT
jgi:chromosome segregation ATPase